MLTKTERVVCVCVCVFVSSGLLQTLPEQLLCLRVCVCGALHLAVPSQAAQRKIKSHYSIGTAEPRGEPGGMKNLYIWCACKEKYTYGCEIFQTIDYYGQLVCLCCSGIF